MSIIKRLSCKQQKKIQYIFICYFGKFESIIMEESSTTKRRLSIISHYKCNECGTSWSDGKQICVYCGSSDISHVKHSFGKVHSIPAQLVFWRVNEFFAYMMFFLHLISSL